MVTNNERLRQIISDNTLTAKSVAIMLPDCSESSVNSWTQADDTHGSRNMPTTKLKYLEIILKSKVKK